MTKTNINNLGGDVEDDVDIDKPNSKQRPEDEYLTEDEDIPARQSVKDEDRALLQEVEAEERLLAKPTRFDAVKDAFHHRRLQGENVGRSRKQNRRIRRKSGRREENSELMFEMEEGFKDTSSQSSGDEVDKVKWTGSPRQRDNSFSKLAVINIFIILLFIALTIGAFKLSRKTYKLPITTFNNGTHMFRPTTILISLDGFRADFLNRELTPALSAFIASGVSPKYMLPSFPSVTFPNHFTLVTGLYPESHGIVGNQFWDPELQEEFYYTNTEVSMQPKWWNAEPLWVTAENQGVRTAIHMWPGSEAHIPDIDPTYVDKYNGSESLTRKVDRILHWLDLPGEESEAIHKRPQLIAAYVPNVDADGHKYGPNSTEIRGTIANVDSMLTMLVEGLYNRNLTEIVNLVIVSDHGMATTSINRMMQLDDLVDMSLVDHVDGWPLSGLRLKNPDRDVPILYSKLLEESERLGNFDVYTLETMPERYHFNKSDRIAPLWIVPKAGWAIVEKVEFDISEAKLIGQDYHPMGLHGYDHEHPLMRAIFIARGPAFPHAPNSRLPIFQNTEVYNIVCDSIGVQPHPNNGTLRLPLKVEGLHNDANAPILDTPYDAPKESHSTIEPILSTSQVTQTFTSNPTSISTSAATTTITSLPSSKPNSPETDGNTSSTKGWWKFLHEGLQKAKEWAKEFVESLKGNRPEQEKNGG